MLTAIVVLVAIIVVINFIPLRRSARIARLRLIK